MPLVKWRIWQKKPDGKGENGIYGVRSEKRLTEI